MVVTNECRTRQALMFSVHVDRLPVRAASQELMWLVGTLVASKNMFDAERLLAGYVLTRRNALSSTAAVEYALIKVNRGGAAGVCATAVVL
jgi:hypothetical protein